MVKQYIIIFTAIILLYLSPIEGRTFKHDESLFAEMDLCSLLCGPNGEQHPICNPPPRSDDCGDDFFLYNVGAQNSAFQRDIMLGHNGIRNRIAERMHVANMVKLKWDVDLELLAKVWVNRCTPFAIDTCASFKPKTIVYDAPSTYLYVNSNTAFVRSNFLPPNLIVSVLRNWYLEKNNMTPPIIIPFDKHIFIKREHYGNMKVGYFNYDNNFTQLCNSDTQRIGCALARYNKGYHFACYYYPYIAKDTFIYGAPVSICPNLYPLQDAQFTNLCTGDGTLSLHFQNNNLIKYFIIIDLFVVLKFFNIFKY